MEHDLKFYLFPLSDSWDCIKDDLILSDFYIITVIIGLSVNIYIFYKNDTALIWKLLLLWRDMKCIV